MNARPELLELRMNTDLFPRIRVYPCESVVQQVWCRIRPA